MLVLPCIFWNWLSGLNSKVQLCFQNHVYHYSIYVRWSSSQNIYGARKIRLRYIFHSSCQGTSSVREKKSVYYERKLLVAGWWLVVGADLVWKKSTACWMADKPSEQSRLPAVRLSWIDILKEEPYIYHV